MGSVLFLFSTNYGHLMPVDGTIHRIQIYCILHSECVGLVKNVEETVGLVGKTDKHCCMKQFV